MNNLKEFKQKSFYSELKSGFEWFYFDIHSPENNLDIVITFHRRVFNVAFDINLLDIFIYSENKQTGHFVRIFKDSDINFGGNPFCISFPNGTIKSNNTEYILNYSDNEISFSLIIDKDKHWAPQQFELFSNLSNNDSFFWSVWVPRGRSRGIIKYDNSEIEVDGISYHDQNWGKGVFNKYLKKWNWGKYITENGILIYGDLKFRNGTSRHLAVLKEKGNYEIQNSFIRTPDIDINNSFFDNRLKIDLIEDDICQIDEFIFNINRIPYSFNLFRKIGELFYINLQKYKPFLPLYYKISNTRYRRFKSPYLLNGKPYPLSFHEEMIFR